MAHGGDARVHQHPDGLGDPPRPALDLDGVGAAFLDGALRRPQGDGGRLLIGPEGQVHHEQRPPPAQPPAGRAAVVQHLAERHGPRVPVPQGDHAQGVAHQRHVDAGRAQLDARRVVVRRHHADLLAQALHAQEAHGRDPPPRRRR